MIDLLSLTSDCHNVVLAVLGLGATPLDGLDTVKLLYRNFEKKRRHMDDINKDMRPEFAEYSKTDIADVVLKYTQPVLFLQERHPNLRLLHSLVLWMTIISILVNCM